MSFLLVSLLLAASSASSAKMENFTVGTSDSATLLSWLEARAFPHRHLAKDLFSVSMDPDSLESLSGLPGIDRVEISHRMHQHDLDVSRTRIEAQAVHLGTGLSKPHHGTGTLVGIVDVGFDLKHYAFLDSAGNSRVIRLWDQADTIGNPPKGFSTGTLYSGTDLAKLTHSSTLNHHGTHVTGLVAGRTYDSTVGEWWGVADGAKIALVDCGSNCSLLSEGLEYLFQLGDSLGLPTVVNMSWGSLSGPHNGKSSDCQVASSLVGAGKLAVVSAGNNGGHAGHVVHSFSKDTAWFALQVSPGTQTNGTTVRNMFFNEAELWSDSGKSFNLWVRFLDSATGTVLTTSPSYSVGGRAPLRAIDQQSISGKDTFWISGTVQKISGQGGIGISTSTSRSGTAIRLAVTATAGTVHGWITEEGLAFLTPLESGCTGCATPDYDDIISDKATCPLFVSVGAIDGATGIPAAFTSRGPGLGKVSKPDISAPGVGVISSLNSHVSYNGWTISGTSGGFSWGPMSGTSMSAPLVTGTIALLLEEHPKLTVDSAIALLKEGSVTFAPDSGYRTLNVRRLFDTVNPQVATGISKFPIAGNVEKRTWITPDGHHYPVPSGARALDSHPGGIAWLRTCRGESCTTTGIVRP